MTKLQGQTALITGAGRGQGRSHAVRLAEEGASIIAVDIASDIDEVGYSMATSDDLEETAHLVEKAGGRVVALHADVRDQSSVDEAVRRGVSELGHLGIVCANAGVTTYAKTWEFEEATWQAVLDVNLSGVWRTIKAAVPGMIEAGRGGSIMITSSAAGRKGIPNAAHYVATKHGVVGLMRTLANELAEHRIRVNTLHPTAVDTTLIHNEMTYRLFCPEIENPTRADAEARFAAQNPLGIPWVDPVDVSNAVVWLASDGARYVTGAEIAVDGGFHNRV